MKADYGAFYQAIALRDSNSTDKAIALFEKLQGSRLSTYLAGRIDRELALAFCKAKDRGRGVDLLNQLIQTEPYPIKTYHLRFDRARCLILVGDEAEAASQLQSLYLTYPEGDLSETILQTLKKIRPDSTLSAQDHLSRAEQLLSHQRPDLAAVDLEEALHLQGNPSWELRKKMADVYFKARRYPEAARALEELRQAAPGLLATEDLENLAKAYSRSDQFDRAIQVYQELAGVDPEKASTYFFKIAFLTMDKGDYAEANRKFLDFLEKYPKHPQRDSATWFLVWNEYLLGRYEEALAYLTQLEEIDPKYLPGKGLDYWRGRILEKLGRASEARTLYQAIAAGDPIAYYGFISAKRLEESSSPQSPPRRGQGGLPRRKIPPPLFLKAPETAPNTTQGRLKELLLVGLWGDFLGELEEATRGEGVPSEFRELQEVLNPGDPGTAQDSGAWADRYPAPYPTLVTLFSGSRRLSPALTWAIMREESRFRPAVVSPANAVGLMQIIPPTGFEIARNLGRNSFTPDDLYRPVVNIEYGAHYLAMNLERFDNDLVKTIASYNAGPEAVERWTRSRPNREWDEFVEEIPYKETNNYVKKVLRSYYVYSLMYPVN